MAGEDQEFPNFRDDDAAKRWEQALPDEIAQLIVVRSALRFAPFLRDPLRKSQDVLEINVLRLFRLLLILTVSNKIDRETKRDALNFNQSLENIDDLANIHVFVAGRKVLDGGFEYRIIRREKAAVSNFFDTDDYSFYQETVRYEAQNSKEILDRVGVWHPIAVPPKADRAWSNLKSTLDRTRSDWRFWIDWYESYLTGGPKNWDLCERIALIPDEDWNEGPAHLNAIIAEMVQLDRQDPRAAARSAVSDAQEEIARHGIGGNYPPEPLGDAPTRDEFDALQASFERLRAELEKNEALDKAIIEAEAKVVRSFWIKTRGWCAKQFNAAATEFSKEVGKKSALALFLYAVEPLLSSAYAALLALLQTL